jgi:hypothetical protein
MDLLRETIAGTKGQLDTTEQPIKDKITPYISLVVLFLGFFKKNKWLFILSSK